MHGWVLICALIGVLVAPAALGQDSWGPPVGSVAPTIAAPDQDGTPRTLENLSGENGLLIFFNRSADW